MTLHQNF